MIISLNEYKQRQKSAKVIKLGDRVVWHDPIFNNYYNATVVGIKLFGEFQFVADLNDKPERYGLELDSGHTIMGSLVTKKAITKQ